MSGAELSGAERSSRELLTADAEQFVLLPLDSSRETETATREGERR